MIPSDAKRLNAFGSRKCRASKVRCVELLGDTEGYDMLTGRLLYKVGDEVVPDSFDEDLREECSNWIHFFITRIEAEMYG